MQDGKIQRTNVEGMESEIGIVELISSLRYLIFVSVALGDSREQMIMVRIFE